MTASTNSFGARDQLQTSSGPVVIHRLDAIEKQGAGSISTLPFSIKVLLEAALRQVDGFQVTEDDVVSVAKWSGSDPGTRGPWS